MTVLDVVALAITAAALVAGAVALVSTRRPSIALAVLLDLLLAAGLLRLTGDAGWQAVATAGAIVALRRLISAGLRIGGGPRSREDGAAGSARKLALARLVRPAWRS